VRLEQARDHDRVVAEFRADFGDGAVRGVRVLPRRILKQRELSLHRFDACRAHFYFGHRRRQRDRFDSQTEQRKNLVRIERGRRGPDRFVDGFVVVERERELKRFQCLVPLGQFL